MVALCATANAQLLDGGFESVTIPGGNSFLDNPFSPAWTHAASGISRGPTWFPTAFEGTNFAFIRNGGGSLTRTLEGLTPGIPYRLRFAMAPRLDGLGADGSLRLRFILNNAPGWSIDTLDNRWRVYELPLTVPTTTSHSLAILSDGGNFATNLDAFQIITTPITESLRGGNFDVPNYSNGQFRYSPSFLAEVPWEYGSGGAGGAGLASEGAPFGPGPAQSGNMYAFLQGMGFAQQTMENLIVGQPYAVRFHSRRNLNQATHRVQVRLNGNVIFGPFTSVSQWTLRTTPIFTATSTRMTLRFEGMMQNGDATHIDTVQLLPGTAGHDLRYSLFLSDVVADSQFLTPVTVTVRQNNSVVHTSTIAAAPFGIFRPEIPLTITGPVQVEFDAPTHLKRKVNITLPPANPNGGFVTMFNGDADGSGEVDLTDVDLVISRYLTNSSQSNYFAGADLDKSGEVDLVDIDVAIANYLLADQ